MIVAVATGAALVLSSAAACGPTQPGGDDDAPTVSTQQPGDDGPGGDDGGADGEGAEDGGADDPGAEDDGGADDPGADDEAG